MSNNDFDKQQAAWMQQPPKQAMQSAAHHTREYINLVNRIAEVIRLTDDIGNKPLDADVTVNDLMLTLVRRGEKLNSLVDMLHEYASRLDAD
jgi:hypothetical protein